MYNKVRIRQNNVLFVLLGNPEIKSEFVETNVGSVLHTVYTVELSGKGSFEKTIFRIFGANDHSTNLEFFVN